MWHLSACVLTLIFSLPHFVSAQPLNNTLVRLQPRATAADRFTGQYAVAVGGNSYQEFIDESVYAGFAARSQGEYRLAEQFRLKGDFQFRARSGRIQSRFEQFNQDVFIQVHEASAVVTPTPWMTLQAGVHSQNFLRSRLLFDDIGFPGFKETLSWSFGKSTVSLAGQQAIPASRSFNLERTEVETLPVLTTETLEWSHAPSDSWDWTLFASHYQFSPLPSIVAFEGRLYGNQSTGELPANSQFRYRFNGLLGGGLVNFRPLTRTEVSLGGQWIENLAAPVSNRAQSVSAAVSYDFGDVVVKPAIEKYFNGRNTGPAVYSDGFYGRNNRDGWAYRLDLDFNRLGFRVSGALVDADVIDRSDTQNRMQAFFIKVETLYVEF